MRASKTERRQISRRVWLVVSGLLLLRPSPSRGASAMAGALEPTQVANFIQLIQQAVKLGQAVKHAKAQVDSWKSNLARFKDGFNFELASSLVTDVSSLIGQYRSLSFGVNSSLEQFKKQYPGYSDPPGRNFEQEYREIDKRTLSSVERSLKAMDVQLNDEKGGLKAEDRIIAELTKKAESAEGVVQALNVTNNFLAVMSKQLQRLETTMVAQAQAMNHYIAGEVQRRAYTEKQKEGFMKFRDAPASDGVNWSREGTRGLL